ncbi:MAG: septum formation initiator family protein [Acidimicrobiia bacterium]|nr:septum formation initiator family protein [Acidimicrobiia bacterium]NNC75735.1 septum formation initiator family protein [Acidimicrobiia bacterium]
MSERRFPAVLVVFLVVGAFVLAALVPFRQAMAQRSQVELTERQLGALISENQSLESELEMLETSEGIERIARERHGLVFPGEESYVVVEPDEDESVVEPRLPEVLPETRPWWQRAWDFVTGRDLVEAP